MEICLGHQLRRHLTSASYINLNAASNLNFIFKCITIAADTFLAPSTDSEIKKIKMVGTEMLSPQNVLDLAVKALGEGQPSLKTSYEAVALIGHACMVAVGFRLVGLGEEHNLGESHISTPFSYNFQNHC